MSNRIHLSHPFSSLYNFLYVADSIQTQPSQDIFLTENIQITEIVAENKCVEPVDADEHHMSKLL